MCIRDRYRTLQLDGELFEIPFKYTSISMDLFDLHPYAVPFPLLASLSVRINSGFFDATGNDIGPFGFSIPVVDLFRLNAAYYDEEFERFVDASIPVPLKFSRIGSGFDPQECVRVVQPSG